MHRSRSSPRWLRAFFSCPSWSRWSRAASVPASTSTEVEAGRKEEIRMSILGWLLLGLISGFVASKMVNRSGSGLLMDIVVGVVGAFVGGFLFHAIGEAGITG